SAERPREEVSRRRVDAHRAEGRMSAQDEERGEPGPDESAARRRGALRGRAQLDVGGPEQEREARREPGVRPRAVDGARRRESPYGGAARGGKFGIASLPAPSVEREEADGHVDDRHARQRERTRQDREREERRGREE